MNKHLVDLLNLGCQISFEKSTRPGSYISVKVRFKEQDRIVEMENTVSVTDLNDLALANLFFIEVKNNFLGKLYS